MKREDLRALGLSDEQVNSVMSQHHQEIDALDTKVTDLSAERDQLSAQVGERDKDLKQLQKNLKDNEEVSGQLAEMKTKYDNDKKKWESDLAQTKLNGAIEAALGKTNAKDPSVLKKLLNTEEIKLNENGEVDGLQNQIDQLAKNNPYLFDGKKKQEYKPAGGDNHTTTTDLKVAMKDPDFNLTKFMEQTKEE